MLEGSQAENRRDKGLRQDHVSPLEEEMRQARRKAAEAYQG